MTAAFLEWCNALTFTLPRVKWFHHRYHTNSRNGLVNALNIYMNRLENCKFHAEIVRGRIRRYNGAIALISFSKVDTVKKSYYRLRI
jgi:hypothetical protein